MAPKLAKRRGRLVRNLRRATQVLSLGFFLWLLLRTELPRGRWDITNSVPAPADLYFQLDPLALVGTTLASRAVHTALLWSLITVAVTLLLGRVFCGWVCPLGALSHFTGWLWRRTARAGAWAARQESSPRQRWKYLMLFAFLAGAVLGVSQVGLLDPLSLTYRSFTVAIVPALGDAAGSGVRGLAAISETASRSARSGFERWLFPIGGARYAQSALIGLLFVALLAAGMALPRLWCRWLCPLGALLGTLSRWQVMRVRVNSDLCSECGLCHLSCEGAADPHRPGAWLAHECLMCWNCVPSCPSGGITIGLPLKRAAAEPALDIGRRRLLGALAVGVFTPPLLRAGLVTKRSDPLLIRPPGALREPEFVSQCIKCGECMKVCPTNFLHPAGFEGGLEGLWTPLGIARRGYCSFECSLCGQVCPTGAIREMPLDEKQHTHIGLAFVDRSRCLPWSFETPCIVCEEQCPTSPKAILLERISEEGDAETLDGPVVVPDECIGCGKCEFVCPVVDLPAIRITSINESRSADNRLTLEGHPGGQRQRRRRGRRPERRSSNSDESN